MTCYGFIASGKGRCRGYVTADSIEEAKRKAENGEYDDIVAEEVDTDHGLTVDDIWEA